MTKTSYPDWMFTMECECELPLCPVCDPDFYHDMEWDFENIEPPF